MRTHQQIDERSLSLAAEVVAIIDGDAGRTGLLHARDVCRRWLDLRGEQCVSEWWSILQLPWERVRDVLLDNSDEGKRLRQSSPFCGVLTPRQRWEIYRKFRE